MKKILFVEDHPDYKLYPLLQWFNQKSIPVRYEIVGSVVSAIRYLANNKVDLIVTDLGLPWADDENVTDLLQGLDIMDYFKQLDITSPVIINSTTAIPNMNIILKRCESRGQLLFKVDSIMDMKEWLMDFLMS